MLPHFNRISNATYSAYLLGGTNGCLEALRSMYNTTAEMVTSFAVSHQATLLVYLER
jgi:hypothetical protein